MMSQVNGRSYVAKKLIWREIRRMFPDTDTLAIKFYDVGRVVGECTKTHCKAKATTRILVRRIRTASEQNVCATHSRFHGQDVHWNW